MTTINEIISVGKIAYEHRYMQTMTSVEISNLELDAPAALVTLAKDPTAAVATFGDSSLGIEIGGKVWAHPDAQQSPEYGATKSLTADVWQYIEMSLAILGKGENLHNAKRA